MFLKPRHRVQLFGDNVCAQNIMFCLCESYVLPADCTIASYAKLLRLGVININRLCSELREA